MQVPLQIRFRHMEPSAELEKRVRERCHKLQRFAEHVACCRVTIDAPNLHQGKTGLYQVSIEITFTDEQAATAHHAKQQILHENVEIAIREVFEAARHQLEEYAQQQRAAINTQESKPHNQTV